MLLEGKVDIMPSKPIIFTIEERIPRKVLPNGTKGKRMCCEVNVVCCQNFIYKTSVFNYSRF